MRYYVMFADSHGYWATLGAWVLLSNARADLWRQYSANPNRRVGLWDSQDGKWII